MESQQQVTLQIIYLHPHDDRLVSLIKYILSDLKKFTWAIKNS